MTTFRCVFLETTALKTCTVKEKGGWGLPSLKNYYNAAQIRTLLCWCNPSYNAQWQDVESKQAIMPLKNLPRYIDDLENPWVKSVLKIWEKVIKEHDLEEDIKILSWRAYDSEFTPNHQIMEKKRYNISMRYYREK